MGQPLQVGVRFRAHWQQMSGRGPRSEVLLQGHEQHAVAARDEDTGNVLLTRRHTGRSVVTKVETLGHDEAVKPRSLRLTYLFTAAEPDLGATASLVDGCDLELESFDHWCERFTQAACLKCPSTHQTGFFGGREAP